MRKRRGISTKALVALLALVLVIGCSLGGSLAWLVDKDEVTNTFTVGDINITLGETTGSDYMILPGVDIPKDPKVTVLKDSEACWLFVKVDEVNWPDFMNGENRKVDYQPAAGWTPLDESNHPGVYYREVDAATAEKGETYDVLLNNKVTVSETLTKSEINGITTKPQLTITAYAVQKEGVATVKQAWSIASTPATP